jgi:hypothetical protein
MRGNPEPASSQSQSHGDDTHGGERPGQVERRVTTLPTFSQPAAPSGRVVGGGNGSANDGVFANLAAKPERGEKTEDHPPVCVEHRF